MKPGDTVVYEKRLYILIKSDSNVGVISDPRANALRGKRFIEVPLSDLEVHPTYSQDEPTPQEDKPKQYEVVVHNAMGSATYLTEAPDVTFNHIMGNTPMIRFVTLDGMIVALPNNVIITQREIR